jgi:hypothetical protein
MLSAIAEYRIPGALDMLELNKKFLPLLREGKGRRTNRENGASGKGSSRAQRDWKLEFVVWRDVQ